MKKLPKNFTTPKQSEYLLNLGIPKDTAEYSIVCSRELPIDWRKYRTQIEEGKTRSWWVFRHYLDFRTYTQEETIWNEHKDNDFMLPSWSAGRLIDIYELCTGKKYKHNTNKALLEDVIEKIEYHIKFSLFHRFNFSKLKHYE